MRQADPWGDNGLQPFDPSLKEEVFCARLRVGDR